MRLLTQRIHDPPRSTGDCTECCLAAILDVPREEVGEFGSDPVGRLVAERRWLLARGLMPLYLPAGGAEQPAPDELCILSGPTERTERLGGAEHDVVGRGLTVVHDPHPSRAGLTAIRYAVVLRPRTVP